MTLPYTSRELSERVEIDVQKRPNRFRRRVWWLALWLCVLAIGWLGWSGASGQHHIFEGGDLAAAHRMFENDCEKCHSTWGPLERVLAADFSSHAYSIDNKKCLACHPGSKHYPTQHPESQQPSCADCHHDHKGDIQLTRLHDRHCTRCHGSELQRFDMASGKWHDATDFPEIVTDFATHPEFAIRLGHPDSDRPTVAGILKNESPDDAKTRHGTRQLVEWANRFSPESENSAEAWIDRAGIRFNHSQHLKVRHDGDHLVWEIDSLRRHGEQEKTKRFSNLNQLCAECHREAPDGRYMLPIVYEEHCQSCHGLFYNGGGKDQLPHDSPDVVLGYLTDRLTLGILDDGADEPASANDFNRERRQIPGRRPALREDQTATLKNRLTEAMKRALTEEAQVSPVPKTDEATQRAAHGVLGAEAKGGCAYCHKVEHKSGASNSLSGWQIVGPRYPTVESLDKQKATFDGTDSKEDGFRMLPSRWMPHSRFSHKGHHMMSCADCHEEATHSTQTADILMPSVRLCQECHQSGPLPDKGPRSVQYVGARADCAECHTYHDHSRDNYTLPLNKDLAPSSTGLDAILTEGSSN